MTLRSPNLAVHNLGPLGSLKISSSTVSETSFPITFTIDPLCTLKVVGTSYNGIVSVVERKVSKTYWGIPIYNFNI